MLRPYSYGKERVYSGDKFVSYKFQIYGDE